EQLHALERHRLAARLLGELRERALRLRPILQKRKHARPGVVHAIVDEDAGARPFAGGVGKQAVGHFAILGMSRIALPASIALTCAAERPSASSACACGAGEKYG